MIEQRRLVVDYVHIDRSEIEETGEYDLEGLFVRLDHAVQSVLPRLFRSVRGIHPTRLRDRLLVGETRRNR